MTRATNETSTAQQRRMYELCWQFEQALDRDQSLSAQQFLSNIDGLSVDQMEYLVIELEAIQQERSQRQQLSMNYKPPEDQRYELVEEIARGGSAVVWRMHDNHLQRDTAVKCLLDSHDNRAMRIRLEREARLCARLVHPGIVPIHELSCFADGRPFVSMKLVEGQTLQQLLDAQPSIQVDAAVEILMKVCQAMAFAHEQRIIHRDLKPGNIMVGKFGEVQVMDWGLAKELDLDSSVSQDSVLLQATIERPIGEIGKEDTRRIVGDRTVNGTVHGTIAYMAPEQARGEVTRLNARSDVFSLGAILCRILTGHAPYFGADQATLLSLAQRAELAPVLTQLRSCKHTRLARIAIACLVAEPSQRPQDAGIVSDMIATAIRYNRLRNRARTVALVTTASLAVIVVLAIWSFVQQRSLIEPRSDGKNSLASLVQPDRDSVPDASAFAHILRTNQEPLVLQYYPQVLEQNDNDLRLKHATAAWLLNQLWFEKAEPLALQLVEQDGNNQEFYFLLGHIRILLGKLELAQQAMLKCRSLKLAAELEVQSIDRKLGEIAQLLHFEKQLSTQSIDSFETAAPSELAVIARVCSLTRRYADAIRLYTKLISNESDPYNASVLRQNAFFQFSKPHLKSQNIGQADKNLVAAATVQWGKDQLEFIQSFRADTNTNSEAKSAASTLARLLRNQPEMVGLSLITQNQQIEASIRELAEDLTRQIKEL